MKSVGWLNRTVGYPLLNLIPKTWRNSKQLRWLSLFCIALLSTLLLVIPALSQQPVTISFLIAAPDAAALKPLVPDFERQNPGIRLNLVEGPNATNQIEDLYTAAFLLGDSPYDLVLMDVIWMGKFAAAGWLQDLSDRVPEAERKNFLPGGITAGIYEDRLYRMPMRSDAGMLYYRTDLLEQAGLKPPNTFAELISTAKTIQTKTDVDWGYFWQGKQYEGVSAMFMEVLKGYGGFWVNADTKEIGLDRPEALAAVNFLISTLREGVSPPGTTTYQEEDARRLFQNGRGIFMRNWPYAWPLLNSDESPIKGKVGIRPMVEMPGKNGGGCLGGWGWGISATTRHAEEAWKVVEYFTSTDTQRKLVLQSGYLPTRIALYSDSQILAKYPYYSTLLNVLKDPALRPAIGQYAQASDILQRYLTSAFSGRMSPEDAMRAATRETRNLLGFNAT